MVRRIKYTDTLAVVARQLERNKASNFIKPFSAKCGDRFVICARVSACVQAHTKNLDGQIAAMRRAIEERGGIVMGRPIQKVGSGRFPASWLCSASALAKKKKAKLLFETTDRAIRADHYHSVKSPNAQADEDDLEWLAFWTNGVELMTLHDPNLSPGEVRSLQTRRGQADKGRKGGRPAVEPAGYKKQRREENLAEALKLHRRGWGYGRIAKKLGRSKSTIADWIRKFS